MLRMIMAALALSASSSLAQSPILDPLLPREDQTSGTKVRPGDQVPAA